MRNKKIQNDLFMNNYSYYMEKALYEIGEIVNEFDITPEEGIKIKKSYVKNLKEIEKYARRIFENEVNFN